MSDDSYETWLQAQPELLDALTGMRWWNALTRLERAHWLERAGSARPSDAWAAYKRTRAADSVKRPSA